MIKVRNDEISRTVNIRRMTLVFFSVIVLAVMIEPAYISNAAAKWLHEIYRFLRYAIAAFVLIFFFFRHTKLRLNMLIISTVIFEGCLFVSTFTKGGDLHTWIRGSAYCVILLFFVQMVVSTSPAAILEATTIVLGLYVHINTLTWILYPGGLYEDIAGKWNCWFLGYDNCGAAIIILSEIIALYHIVSARKWFNVWNWSILISGNFFIFRQGIATIILVEAVAIIFLFMVQCKAIRKIIGSARAIIIGMLVLFILLQFFSVQENTLFAIILNILGKDTTLTGRTRVWKMGWDSIFPKHIVLGMGMQTVFEYIARFEGVKSFSHLHCYYLQVLYDGGILAFGSFVFLLLQVAKRFDKGEKDFSDMVLLAGLLVLLLIWQVEAYSTLNWYFFILLTILYNVSVFKQLSKEKYPIEK